MCIMYIKNYSLIYWKLCYLQYFKNGEYRLYTKITLSCNFNFTAVFIK